MRTDWGAAELRPGKNQITPEIEKSRETIGFTALLVDLKGIEPSNLTDANRALSQLSYKPECRY